MTTERWQRIESLCHAALARPATERAAFLAAACGDDNALRQEVESLLAHAGSESSFLESPAVSAVPEQSLVGRQLGAYRLDALVGAGGMGEVYRAKDTRLGRDVAVKVLPEALAGDAQRRGRFEREARAIASLRHPNICTLHDVGHDAGVDFLVMELVEGESLASRLSKGPLSPGEALAHGMEIADALDTAHRQGIVHRDLKPANVMLTGTQSRTGHDAHVKLLDFGLARIVGPAAGAAVGAPGDSPPVTQAGALLGTLHYMSPEQVEGRAADARSDIFAFGALLYEMLTARRAFEGASPAALVAAILGSQPPAVPQPELDRIVRRCLAKEPLRRYQSARDLLNDLDEASERVDSGRAARRRSMFQGKRAAWFAVGLLALAATVGGYLLWPRTADDEAVPVQLFQLQPPPGVEVLAGEVRSALAVSPDGRWVAFRGVEGRRDDALYLRSVGELDARKVASGGNVPFFSPDSQWLGFLAENVIYKVAVGGGRPQRICNVPNTESVRGASWSRDDTIVFSIDRALARVSALGGEPQALTHPESTVRHYWPHVLPAGNAALFTIARGNNDRWRQIGIVSLEDGRVSTLPGLSGTVPRYVPSGHVVFIRFGALHAVPFDAARLEVAGQPVKILDDISSFSPSGSAGFDVSASGSLAYIPGAEQIPEGDLIWLDRQGKVSTLVERRGPYTSIALAPDGNRLAVAIGEQVGEAELSVYEIDRGAWTQRTQGMFISGSLAWTPDGNWILATSFKSAAGDMYRIPARAGEPERLTADDTLWEYPGSVSPDGSTVLFMASRPSGTDLMTLKMEPGGVPQPFTRTPGFSQQPPRISPDGRWVAYASNESGRNEIHVRPFAGPGEAVRVSYDRGINPMWSEDGRELFYLREPEIWSVRVEPSDTFRHAAPRLLFRSDVLESSRVVILGTRNRFIAIRRDRPSHADRQLVYVPNWIAELKRAFRRAP